MRVFDLQVYNLMEKLHIDNYEWFAQVFVSKLLHECLQEQSDPALSNLTKNVEKLSKLSKRISGRKRERNEQPDQSHLASLSSSELIDLLFSGQEAPFFKFLNTADSFTLNRHIMVALSLRIQRLSDPRLLVEHPLSPYAFEVVLYKLRTLAKVDRFSHLSFIDFLLDKPHFVVFVANVCDCSVFGISHIFSGLDCE